MTEIKLVQRFSYKGVWLIQPELQKYIKEVIKKTQEETTSVLIRELKQQGLIKPVENQGFRKTETLLFNYKEFKKVITKKEELIEQIQAEGIAKKSKDLVVLSNSNTFNTSSDSEKAEEQIEQIKCSIQSLKNYIRCIDDALNNIRTDPYYDLIRLRYFEEQTREEIADYFGVDVATVSRNKSRLINKLKIYLFPSESMVELLC